METVIQPTLELLEELYIGTNGQPTFVIDRYPGEGLTAVIKNVTATEASTPSISGGSTIAAHTEHIRWSLDYALEFYSGKIPQRDWKDSWGVHEVGEEQWQQLQKDLLEVYGKLTDTITNVSDWSNPMLLKGTLALVPHAAYHLSAVKQLLLAARDKQIGGI
jgi:hypothetical protein